MKEIKIYTAGKMSGISLEAQMNWRMELEYELRKRNNTDCKVTFIHPPNYFNYEEKSHKTEREILEWEMKQIHDSDIVIVNFGGIESSIGTCMELGAINGINRFGNRYIYVIGIGEASDEIHPWIKESCLRIEDTYCSAAKYIAEYLLV